MPAEVYVGSYPRAYHADTVDVGVGISVFSHDGARGPLDLIQEVPALRPGWLAPHPTRRFLYAANEVRTRADGTDGGLVTAYAVDQHSGRLAEVNAQLTEGSPCHAVVDATGSLLLVSTFHGSTVHVFPIEDDGRIGDESSRVAHAGSGIHPTRQREPHPHAVVIDPANRYVLVPDLGTDRVEVHELDVDARTLRARPRAGVSLPPGTGPRHLVFHPGGRWVFVVGEMDATVTTLEFDPLTGTLAIRSTLDVLPDEVPGYRSAAEILVRADGSTVYVTHRSHGSSGPRAEGGEDCVVWFDVDTETGRLTRAGRLHSGGAIPRACCFDASGTRLLVAHQGSGTIIWFDIEPDGSLLATGVETPVAAPVCLAVLPA